jgi:hypothetical protein
VREEIAVTKKILALALGLVLATAGAASAQIATGNVYGIAKDDSGAVLPGVNVTLTSEFGTRNSVTGTDGAFRFLSLEKGEYTVTLSLAGFASTARKIKVTTGENVELEFAMKVSGVAETVEVQAETPLVDSDRRGTATTMTSERLAQVPNARDTWGVLRAVPGVMVDRVNIAGNENGQQATSSSKGQPSAENTWNLDGMVITDMSATGGSPTYFDFGAFQEITVTTGGTDLTMATGGAGINLTTRRGTNAFHGSARYMVADEKLSFGNISDQSQAPFTPNDLATDPRLRNADGTYRDPGRPHQQHQGLRLRPRRPDHQGQAVVLRQLRQAGHQTVAADEHARRHAVAVVQRQAQLAGHFEHDGVGLLLPRQQAEIRPLAGQRALGGRQLPLGPGQRVHRRRAARRHVEAAGRPHLLTQPFRLAEGDVLRHRLRSGAAGATSRSPTRSTPSPARRSAPTSSTWPYGLRRT